MHVYNGLTVRVMLSQVIELPVLNSPRGVVPPDLSIEGYPILSPPFENPGYGPAFCS